MPPRDPVLKRGPAAPLFASPTAPSDKRVQLLGGSAHILHYAWQKSTRWARELLQFYDGNGVYDHKAIPGWRPIMCVQITKKGDRAPLPDNCGGASTGQRAPGLRQR